MAVEAFLRSIVPAVAPAGHGLAELLILKDVDEAVAGVMTALVGVILNSA
jgi:hypothetical protein